MTQGWNRDTDDRRKGLRFEVMGGLWGTLHGISTLTLHDIGRGGALVEAGQPLQIGSEHDMRIVLEAHVAQVPVKVAHIRPAGNPGRQRYLIGLEFLATPEDLAQSIDDLAGPRES